MPGQRRLKSAVASGWNRLAMVVMLSAMAIAGQTACMADDGRPVADEDGLRAFETEEELADYLSRLRDRHRSDLSVFDVENEVPEADTAMDELAAPEDSAAPRITNNQTEGVDEGGIVKAHGDMLVVLRRGRIFTISTADGSMRAIDAIDAFPPGASGSESWYDEMLIVGDRIFVIGYSYRRGGTEVNRFRLSENGELRFEDAHHLASADYYSAENYASRLIGEELIFYAPLGLHYENDPLDALPGVRRWRDGEIERDFERIAEPGQIFIADDLYRDEDSAPSTLHSVTRCNVASDDFDCTATGVIAGWSREFYVSRDAVYLWIGDGDPYAEDGDRQSAHIYRLPLDGTRPAAIGARGMPIDQFSFLEQPDEDRLNILVTDTGLTPRIEEPRRSGGTVSLIQLSLADFGDGSGEVPGDRYRHFEDASASSYEMENRYVGDHIVFGYGSRSDYGDEGPARLFAAALDGGPATLILLDYGVERIERLGADAVVIGSDADGDMGFSAITLGARPQLANVFVMPSAAEGESRSHAFFYLPDAGSDDATSGTLGLPIARTVEPRFQRLFGSAVSMLFLRRDDRRFSLAGELGARVEGAVDDNCRASCTDWYGNARPIFLRGRIFALLGYELVEGRLSEGTIGEIGRTNFAPAPPPETRAPAE